MDIEILTKDNCRELFMIESECFSHPWTEKMFEGDLRSENTIYLGARADGKLIGYAGAWVVLSDADITNVAVSPRYRRRGIAGKLLERLISEAKKRGADHIRLEVRKSNEGAIRLYKKTGFSQIAVRAAYYEDNKEDALIMEKNLEDEDK